MAGRAYYTATPSAEKVGLPSASDSIVVDDRHFVVYWGDSPAGTVIFDIPYEEMGKRSTFVLGDGDGRVSGPLNVEKVVRK